MSSRSHFFSIPAFVNLIALGIYVNLAGMAPVLISVGDFSVSSFGAFLSLAVILSIFTIWRVARSYEINEDRVFDISVLTFIFGLLTARIGFVLFNLPQFNSLTQVLFFHKYPGLSLWSGLIGGMLAFWLLTKKFKLNFWQVADFAAVAALLGIAVGDFGCYLAGCSFGVTSTLPISTSVVGVIGKRFPVQLFEALLLLLTFRSLWRGVLRFHFSGKIFSLFLIFFGLIRFISGFYKDSTGVFWVNSTMVNIILPLMTVGLGLRIFYKRSKRSIIEDIKFLGLIFISSKERRPVLLKLKRGWYNHKINFRIRLGSVMSYLKALPANLKRRLNVKPTPKNFI